MVREVTYDSVRVGPFGGPISCVYEVGVLLVRGESRVDSGDHRGRALLSPDPAR